MANNEGWTTENATKLLLIGVLQNNWRLRLVEVYLHPNDETKVVSIGRPFNGSDPIVCVENKDAYRNTIFVFPKVDVYN